MIKRLNLFDAFKNAMLANPKASRKEAFSTFLETMRSDPRWIETLADDCFYRFAANWRVEMVGGSSIVVATPAQQRRSEVSAEARKAARVRAEKVYQDLKRTVLLDLVMPNGKKFREATGAECAKAGGFYAEVARRLKPTQVVDKHLCERDLQNIWARFRNAA